MTGLASSARRLDSTFDVADWADRRILSPGVRRGLSRRFDRHGNRQLNAAFYRIALTQLVRVIWRTLRSAGEPRLSPSPS